MLFVPSPVTLVPPTELCHVPAMFVRSIGSAPAGAAASATTRVSDGASADLKLRIMDASAGSAAPGAGMAPPAALQRCQRAAEARRTAPSARHAGGSRRPIAAIRTPNVEYRHVE